MKYRCIKDHQGTHAIDLMCRALHVSRAGFYAWSGRKPSRRALRDLQIVESMKALHEESNETYGSPRLHAGLHKQGFAISRKRVARLMHTASITVKTRRRFKATTNSKHDHPIAENLLDRHFAPQEIKGPNRVYAGDITYIDTAEGWLYLAVVIDLWSRRVVGWAMSHRMTKELVNDALHMAFVQRETTTGILYHSDRGSQYASDDHQKLLKDYGMTCSMSRKGNCWDNAVVESFNATLKTELIHRRRWNTREEARAAIFKYLETWYNIQRLHSTLGYRSPAEFEALYAQAV
jgi:transposase InsO family protein